MDEDKGYSNNPMQFLIDQLRESQREVDIMEAAWSIEREEYKVSLLGNYERYFNGNSNTAHPSYQSYK